MEILVADDEQLILEGLVSLIEEIVPEAKIHAFHKVSLLKEYIQKHTVDIAFLDIEMGATNGIVIAKELKLINPKVNIIFVTGYSEYMETAFSMHASGYIKKPFSKEEIKDELDNLRFPIKKVKDNILQVQCFGNFEVSINGKNLRFERTKTKEFLAYLIDQRGNAVTSAKIRIVLWEEATNDQNTAIYFQKLKKDLITTLKKEGIEDIFIKSWNNYSIDPTKISCDYYDWLNNKPEGIQAYNGEYMKQYDWAKLD
ncbi:MAG: response regulator [Erysipelotrichaceae bacterium]|nr:response regulator [uncultured Faecalibacillus sp.]MBE5706153.1 response regulator [Erysipelotrichaceae bacterium]MBS4903049.1 response regulator [Coprobacillus sp.]